MLTSRGWWFLLCIILLLGWGVLLPALAAPLHLGPRDPLPLPALIVIGVLGLTLGLWFCAEWLLFAVRVKVMMRRLKVRRLLSAAEGPTDTLWTGRSFQVQVWVGLPSGVSFPYVTLSDRLPFAVEMVDGSNEFEGALQAGGTASIAYEGRCPAAGSVRFEGLRLQTADLQGFFYHATFIPAVAEFPVLPPVGVVKGTAPLVKRHNFLLPPGIHRFHRPGSGSELLDLRDYLPGDPPKTIAWKVSARRDRLITKEFESDVPVRCTLFVDTSSSVRLGGFVVRASAREGWDGLKPALPATALSRLVEIGTAVAQAASGTRDLVGLCLFDERHTTYVRPARGRRHLVRLLNLLAGAAGLVPTTGKAALPSLLPIAYSFAQEVYPDLLRPEINQWPWWWPWLQPQQTYTVRKPGLGDRLFGRLTFLMALYGIFGWMPFLVVMFGAVLLLESLKNEIIKTLALAVIGVILLVSYLVMPRFLFFQRRRRQMGWRKRLAALLSVRYGLAPGGLAVLLEDDERFSLALARFLADHRVPFPLTLYDEHGRYLFAAPEKIDVLARALLRAVGKGHDNELFVLLADLLELPDELGPLLRAVKVALARHHRVVVVCPWPPGLPPPSEREPRSAVPAAPTEPAPDHSTSPEELLAALHQTTHDRFQRGYYEVRRTFGRLGVPVVCARTGDPARLILERLDLLRGVGRTR
jgi:uncharacterized protein (DUF58 family)